MNDTTFPWLTTLVVLPLVGAAAVCLLPASARRWARQVAVGVSLVTLVVGVLALGVFDVAGAGTVQLTERVGWIPAFGVSYALGVNGLGLSLILLALFLVPLVLLAAWHEHQAVDGVEVVDDDGRRIRNYVALVLVLEAFMVAVFAARDVFLFYVLFEAMLIPVYFMIGVFGGLQRRYAAVKFLIYSLVGGLVMLVGVIALYLQGPGGPDPAGTGRSSSPSRSRHRCGRCTPGCPTPPNRRRPGPTGCWSACWTRSARSARRT